jgi:FMN phosphatase YigB (HAD superfamily)
MSFNVPAEHVAFAHKLGAWFSQNKGKARVLSLDCFDTLLWRKRSDPKQVFNELQNHDLFRQWRVTALTRIQAEKRAREQVYRQRGTTEVTIEEIYRFAIPDASAELISQFVQLEVEFEQECLFVFKPMLDLMKLARKAGLKVVVASDMYIRRPHLKAMIDSSLARLGEAFELDAWYTSADSQLSKSQGLHKVIARDLKVKPAEILHLGDSAHADYHGARAAGARGYYLERFGPHLTSCLDQNRNAQVMLADSHGDRTPITCTMHPVWAALPPASNLQEVLGWYYLGPVLMHFARGLKEHLNAHVEEGRRTRLVFMMRDGYMPLNICRMFHEMGYYRPEVSLHSIDVSRLSTIGASFRTEDDIRRYVFTGMKSLALGEILTQLATPMNPAGVFDLARFNEEMGLNQFLAYVTEPVHLRNILACSAKQRDALKLYLNREVAPKSGDAVILVDLGYSGTIQDHLAPIITEEFGCSVQGYYMLLRDTERAHSSKFGFLSSHCVAGTTVELLITQIQTLEQLTCNSNGSVRGFTSEGRPIFEENLVSEEQIRLKEQIQLAASDFAAAGGRDYLALPLALEDVASDAMGLLGRLLLHPTQEELDLYGHFMHDINNGTARKRFISNLDLSRNALIRGGLMNFDADVHKMFVNDLAAFSPAYSFYGWAKYRFGLKPDFASFEDKSVQLRAVLSGEKSHSESGVSVFSTHEGFRLAVVPIVPGTQAVGLNLGLFYKLVQVQSVGLAMHDEFLKSPHWNHDIDVSPSLQIVDGKEPYESLYSFDDPNGFLYVPLPRSLPDDCPKLLLTILFRPLAPQSVDQVAQMLKAVDDTVEHA